jgi:hypothetical protein
VSALALGLGSASAQTPPIFTRNGVLRLPVQLDDRARADVAQIKLYVRGPNGKWECVQTAPSSQAVFDFRAPADGEYLFTFVTVDRRGNTNPPSVETAPAHRAVVVDTTPPEVTAMPIPMRGGERALQCQVRDANPDWTSLKVFYLGPDNAWVPLAVAGPDTPTVFKVPSPGVLEGKIQVVAADKAGNRTSKVIDLGDPTVSLALPKAAIDKGKPDPTMFPKDDAAGAAAPAVPDRNVRGAGYADLPKAPRADLPALPDLPDIKPPQAASDIRVPDAPPMKAPDLRPPVQAPVDDLKLPDVPPPPGRGAASPGPKPTADDLKLPDLPADPRADKPLIDVPGPVAAPSKSMKPNDAPPPPVVPASAVREQGAKPTSNHPILNTRTCTVNYQLDGPTRYPNKIDFWASTDGGRTWMQVKDLNGGIPPAKLALPGDGVFSLRIRPGAGPKPPEPMEDPDCVVEIDTTRPVVNMTAPTLVDDGVLVINWTASDENLLSNSVNLYYAPKPAGPWEVIVSGYKNTGEYKWTLPQGLTGPVYLRAEASDRAGNVGRYELPTPVALEAGKQRVKVIGVGPGQ